MIKRIPIARRTLLLAGTGVLTLAHPAIAMAAEAETAAAESVSAESDGGEIIVSGIRRSLDDSIETKRAAATIVDAISSEDIGKFPDANIAESVQRITGVQINRVRGEGRTVNIRGLPANFTLVTYNGRTLPNALYDSAESRSFDFSLLPSEFVSTLEVYKSPSANLVEGGLSGTVNIRTPRALDIGKRVLSLAAEGQYESNSAKITPKVSALFADTFLDNRLGLSLGVGYSRRKPETHQNEVNYSIYTEGQGLLGKPNKDLNGDGVIEADRQVRIPSGVFFTIYDEDIERLSSFGSLEFKATDTLTFSLDSFYSKLKVRTERNPSNNSFAQASDVIAVRTEIIGGVETATEFEVAGLDVRNNGRLEDSDGYLWSTNLGARFENDGWSAGLGGSYSRSHEISNTLNIANQIFGRARFSASPGDKVASIEYLDGFEQARTDPTTATILNLNGTYDRRATDTQYEARFDAGYEFGNGFLRKVEVGGQYLDRTKYEDNWTLSITPAGVSALYGGLPAGPRPGTVSAAPFLGPVQAGNGIFLGSYSGDAVFPTSWLTPDTRAFVYGLTKEELIAAGRYTNDATGITDVKEKSLALYARGDFEAGRISGNFGLRAIRTRQQTVGVSPDLSAIVYEIGGGITRVPAAEPITVRRSYWDFLPSLNVKVEAGEDLLLRFAASRTMARPNLGDISPTTSANGNLRTITQNNPNLDPFRSNNLDATIEWYFARSGLVGASVFYKDIQSLVRRETSAVILPIQYVYPDGTSSTNQLEFVRSGLVNGGGVKVKGIELFYQQAFTFLPSPLDGLGTSLNYTFIDNGDPTQLTAASKHNFNATGYYEKGPVGLRLTYSWRSSFLSDVAVAPLMSQKTRAFGTLDASLSVKVGENASIVLQAVNLTDADESKHYDTLLPSRYIDTGRRFSLAGRISF